MVRARGNVFDPDRRYFFDEKKAKDLERRQRARNKRVGSLTPQKQFAPPKPPKVGPSVTSIDPDKVNPSVSIGHLVRMFGKTVAPFAAAVLSPTRAADATYDTGPFYFQKDNFHRTQEMQDLNIGWVDPVLTNAQNQYWRDWNDKDIEWKEPEPLPELNKELIDTGRTGFFVNATKPETIINVPDYILPPPVRFDPYPELFPDSDVRFEPWPTLIPPATEVQPEIDIDPPTIIRGFGGNDVKEDIIVIEITNEPQTETKEDNVTIRIRRTRVRASRKRRKDTKAHSKWLKAAGKMISMTYGTYTEVRDVMEAIAYNAYVINDKGEMVSAVAIEDGSMLKVMKGIGEGRYELDIGKTIVDFTVMQATDAIVGKMNKKIVKDWIDTGTWTSMSGPSSFINRQTEDFSNVSSLFTSK